MEADRPKRVLVIDDSEDFRDTFRELLEGEGHSVSTAADGLEGLAVVRAFRPDLVIVDGVMPVMDGLGFLRHLRSDFAPPLPPVIVCSGFKSLEANALAEGAYAFVQKPAAISVFLGLVAQALAATAPDPVLLERGREYATQARSTVVDAAEDALAPTPFDKLIGSVRDVLVYLRGYFDVDDAFAAVIRSHLVTIMSLNGDVRERPLSGPSSSIGEIISTGSTLVLADVTKHAAFARDLEHLDGIHSLVAVPVLARSGVVVGAICLARKRLEPFDTEDVLILQAGGRRASHLIERVDAGETDPFREFPFIATGTALHLEAFQFLVDMELRLAARRQDAVELALVNAAAPFTPAAMQAAQRAVDPHRWAIGQLGRQQLAFFKRAPDAAAISRQIEAATEALQAVAPRVDAVSVAVAGGAVAALDAPLLFQLAARELATGRGSVHLDRLFVGHASPAPPQPTA